MTPFALVDLAVIGPCWLHLLGSVELDLRVLRVLRLLRLLKLMRDFIPALRLFRQENKGRTLRKKVHALRNEMPTSGALHHQNDLMLMIFIILSVVAVDLETVPSVHDPFVKEFA
ncbi:MAG: hypothetical protein ACK5F5_07120 [Gammaproteobacteria bacterium]